MPRMKIDRAFKPLSAELAAYRKLVAQLGDAETEEVVLCVNSAFSNFSRNLRVKRNDAQGVYLCERLLKSLLWVVGGNEVFVYGSRAVYEHLSAAYKEGGAREFDALFMARVYEAPFKVVYAKSVTDLPVEKRKDVKIGGNLKGCRIGFDAGGSDMKVSAVKDGDTVFSEEIVWFPKTHSDWQYHYQNIKSAIMRAAEKLERVDCIGVSSAGIYIDNKAMVASLFNAIPRADFDAHVKNIYIDVAAELGATVEVANDGDVTALAGGLSGYGNNILGIAMGTSEAGGYINENGRINGWLNELAFVPVDANGTNSLDEWSGDAGCGVKYFSQDAVIKLATLAGYKFDESLSLAEKLKVIQKLMASGDSLAQDVYHDVGVYLAYAIAYYAEFYSINTVLLLGRVASGEGGDKIVEVATDALNNEFADLGVKIRLPDEQFRRVGQSIAAASLPQI